MRPKRSRQNIVSINNYNIDGSTPEEVEHHPYLGVELGNDLNLNHHIDQTTTKANGILAFLRRNLNKCSKEVKEKAYTTLVRPNLEYDHLYGTLSANIKLMQLKWSNVELPAL